MAALSHPALPADSSPVEKPKTRYRRARALWLALEVLDPLPDPAALESLACFAESLTPIVVLKPGEGLLLEVQGSLKIFSGLAGIKTRLTAELARRGLTCRMATAPTPLAASWLARCESVDVADEGALAGAIGRLPLAATAWPEAVQLMLRQMGLVSIADCLRLPRSGFARRVGRERLDDLDRALGKKPDFPEAYESPQTLCRVVEFVTETTDQAVFVSALSDIAASFEQTLRQHQKQVREVTLAFRHLRAEPTRTRIRFVDPVHARERILDPLLARIERLCLSEPAVALSLTTSRLLPLKADAPELLPPSNAQAASAVSEYALVECLRGRFGARHVHGIDWVAEHRPERAWRRWIDRRTPETNSGPACPPHGRPLWLLPEPQRRKVGRKMGSDPIFRSGADRERLVGWLRCQARLPRRRRRGRREALVLSRLSDTGVVSAWPLRLGRAVAMSAGYAELHCLSNFTFLRGASHPEELVERAGSLGYSALALTDECSLAGIVRAHTAAKDCRLKLIAGAELRAPDGLELVVLAPNREAYGDLSALISAGRRNAAKGDYRIGRDDLERHLEASDCLVLWLPGELPDRDDGFWLKSRFEGRLWLAVELFRSGRDGQVLAESLAAADALGLRAVASGDVHLHEPSRRMLQDTLTAIRLGKPVADLSHALYPNAERALRPIGRLEEIYPRGLLDETLAIAERFDFSLTELRYEYPSELVPDGLDAAAHLRELTEAGMRWRWPEGVAPKVVRQIEHELALIAELGYEPYFLTVHDIVRFARSEGILCQGRGSAANSAVCFCLGITEVDPARMEMLMERFISKERNEPPDIDVDFEHERREEVIQYIYGKYSRERAALAATVITYRPRSAIRDVGKALGLSLDQVDTLAKSLQWWDDADLAKARFLEIGLDPDGLKARQLFALVETLIGFPRHLSQHVGGFVISAGPLGRLVPIENAAMPDRTVIQWDKDDLDELGLLKIDVLGLGMLSAIRKSFELIEAYSGRKLDVAGIPAEDPAVYRMIGEADTMGVFQIESRAQMAMLPRLKPECYYDLVIEVAIIRPGPIQGDMVHPYLRRRNGEEAVTYPSEAVRSVLERTLGVPLFQEQVMQLAIVAAGFTPGEADQLRRAMAAWKRRGGLGPLKDRLIGGMLKKGYAPDFAEQIFNQIKGFGEYGFPESHSASFALLVYVSAWLKCHEPAAFFCALLNSQPMGFYAPAQLLRTARRQGVAVYPAMIDVSGWDSSLEPDRDGRPGIRLGFRLVKGLSQAGADRIEAARSERGFTDLEDLARRANLDQRDIGALAAAGALKPLADHRHRARWAAAGIDRGAPLLAATRIPEGIPLLRRPSEGEDIAADYAATGLSLGRHPLALLRARLDAMQMRSAAGVAGLAHDEWTAAAGLVITRQRPASASGVVFVTLEDETGYLNLIVWERIARRARRALLESRLMGVRGRVQRDGAVLHLIASELCDLSGLLGRLVTRSRDFQ